MTKKLHRVKESPTESSITAIVVSDIEGNVIHTNPAFLRLWGYADRGEVLGKRAVTFFQDEERALEVLGAVKRKGSWVGELAAIKREGEVFPVRLSADLIMDVGGRALCTVTSFPEANGKKGGEEAFRQGEEKFRLLFEKSADAILLLDNGKTIDCNRAALDMMGCGEKDQILGLCTPDLSPEMQPDGRLSSEKAEEMRAAAFREGSNRFEWNFRKIDGPEFPAEVRLTSIPLGDRRILHCLVRDITKRRRAEEDLRRSRQQMAEIINFLPDPTWAVDCEGRITVWNREAERLTGIMARDMIGKGDLEHALPFYGERRPLLIDLVLNPDRDFEKRYDFIEREGNTLIGEVHALIPGNEKRYFWGKAAPIYSHDGKISGAIETVRDITRRKRAEEEKRGLEAHLRQAQKMEAMGALAGGIAHDFNNILTALMGYAELAQYSVPEKEEALYCLDQIIKAGYRARDLVRQILAFSRQTEQERQPVRVGPILKETLKLLRASLPRTISIGHEIDTERDAVMADPTQIHQVMMNLCTNAHHAMAERAGHWESGSITSSWMRRGPRSTGTWDPAPMCG